MTEEEMAGTQPAAEVAETNTAVEVVPQEQDGEEKPVVRSRKFIEEVYPDRQFESDEDAEEALFEYLTKAKQTIGDNDAANEAIAEILFEYPEFAEIMEDLKKGLPLRVALARHFDPEDLKVMDGEDDASLYQDAVAGRTKRRAEADARIKEREENMKLSEQEVTEFMDELGWDDDRQIEFQSWIQEFINDFSRGSIKKPILKKLKQAYEFEEKVAEAREEGEIDGRNAAIEAKRVKKLENTDGMPTGSAGAVSVAEVDAPERDFFDDVIERQEKRKWK